MDRRHFATALGSLLAAASLPALAGVVLGAFTNCERGEGFGGCFKPLGIPVYRRARFGHIKKKFTLPIGLPVEMDAGAGTRRLMAA